LAARIADRDSHVGGNPLDGQLHQAARADRKGAAAQESIHTAKPHGILSRSHRFALPELAMKREPTEQSFLIDVARHEMILLRDDGLNRHIRVARPGTYCMQFELVTWPGYLACAGDMGCFVFSRIADMFEFFRPHNDRPELQINLGYWAEKAQAESCTGGIKEYSPDLFRENIERWLNEREASAEVRAEVEDEVLNYAHDGEYPAMDAACRFKSASGFRFTDFWEANCQEYTYHFVWCCYAMVWGIRQYDAAKVKP
jgi:hypothetical protein